MSDTKDAVLTSEQKALADTVKTTVSQEFEVRDKALKEEIAKNFKAEMKGLASKEYLEDQMSDLTNKVNESTRTILESPSAMGKALTLKAFVRSVTRTDSFKEKLQEAVQNKSNFGVDFEGIAKGLNLYGEASANGITDTNIFETGDSAVALDNLFDVVNAEFITGIRFREAFIFNYITLGRTAKPIFSFAEYFPKGHLGFDTVKEGGLKPSQDLVMTTSRVTPIKVAKHMSFTEEIWDDLPRIESEVTGMLFKEFLLKREDLVLNYDDPDNNLRDGIFNNAVSFDGTTVGDPVQDASLADVIIALANQVNTAENYVYGDSYKANVAVVNPKDLTYGLVLKKDAENNYQMWMLRKFMREEFGIEVISSKSIPEGNVLVGDLSKYKVYEYKPYSLRFGWINDEFIYNQFSIVAEGRHYQFLATQDKIGIVYDSIANVKTLIS